MNPINWKSISAPSIDINSKPENKVDEKNKGFNTYRSNQKVDSNPSTSKLTNQPALIKQASSHITQNSGGTINHIKNSTPKNQPLLTKQVNSHITQNSAGRANSKEMSKEEKALERKISANVDTLKVAVYRNNEQSKSTKIELEKFEVIAKELLSKSTKSQNIDDLLKFKSDLKEISGYLNKNIYSEIKNSLDTQLKVETTSGKNNLEILKAAVKNYNNFVDGFNKNADRELAENGKFIEKKVTINTSSFEIISRNILNESSAPLSKKQLEAFKSDLKEIKSFLNEKNYYQLKNSLDSRLKVALDHKRRV
jgi:hypothetical protein